MAGLAATAIAFLITTRGEQDLAAQDARNAQKYKTCKNAERAEMQKTAKEWEGSSGRLRHAHAVCAERRGAARRAL